MVAVYVVAVFHHVVLEHRMVSQASQSVAGKVFNDVVLDQRMRSANRDAEIHVPQSLTAKGDSLSICLDAVRKTFVPVGG